MAAVNGRLKAALKKIAYWGLPEGVSELAVRQWRSRRQNRREIKEFLGQNEKFRNCHKGKRCFILACGPSIKQQDLSSLKDEICISVSNFFVHPNYDVIRPMYHCVPDVLIAHNVHHPDKEYVVKWFQEMGQRLGDAVIFVSDGERRLIESRGIFRSQEVHYLHFSGNHEEVKEDEVDLTQPLPFPASSSVLALMIAVYMGFKEIYLLGCDHDWILHQGTSRHFYAETENILATRPGYSEWTEVDYELEFKCCWRLWKQYKTIYRYGKNQGIEIYNATKGGLLDIFPRVNYEALFVT